MRYRVFQIHIDRARSNRINAGLESEFFEAYRNVIFNPNQEKINAARNYYVEVCRIEANSLNDVFRIGNFVDEDAENFVERLAPMSSLSVGNVIVDENDEAFLVAPFGFDRVVF